MTRLLLAKTGAIGKGHPAPVEMPPAQTSAGPFGPGPARRGRRAAPRFASNDMAGGEAGGIDSAIFGGAVPGVPSGAIVALTRVCTTRGAEVFEAGTAA